ncbi:MAG: aldo/keto reductase [Lachnospiraceae bacterium]|nr:aldo/keto reductase [Lachnospiraceae bacterium]
MKMRKFGKLGFESSAFGLGCMRFTSKVVDGETVVDEEKAIDIIRTAIDGGTTYMDTAYVYLGGKSEVVLGKALQDGYRDKVTIATKIPVDRVKEYADIDRILNEELERLQTDHIDFWLMHGLNKEKWEYAKKMGLPERFVELQQEGKIRFKCFSFHGPYEEFEYIIKDFDWDMCQIQYNFMDINNQAGTKGLELAGSLGIPVVIMEGLLGGRLAKAPDNVQAVYDAFPVKRSPVEWAFRWLCNHPEVGTVLSGCTEVEQVKDNLRIFDTVEPGIMDEDELKLMDDIRAAYQSRTRVGCTGCEYCMPCPGGLMIPRIFAAWNEMTLYNTDPKDNWQFQAILRDGHGPENCLQCGACEAACPQGLPIIDLMQQAVAELE